MFYKSYMITTNMSEFNFSGVATFLYIFSPSSDLTMESYFSEHFYKEEHGVLIISSLMFLQIQLTTLVIPSPK